MDNKPGRNDPCHCGSGKKYKKCHMPLDKAAEKDARDKKQAATFITRDIMTYARDDRFATAVAQAMPLYWNDFYNIENAEEMSADEALRFFDWFMFDYPLPAILEGLEDTDDEEEETAVEDVATEEIVTDESAPPQRLFDIYHQERWDDLSSHQQTVVTHWQEAKASGAYELLAYDGQRLQLRDFFTNEEVEIFEPGGRGVVEIGEVILGRLVMVGDDLAFSTTAAYLPKDEIAGLKEIMDNAKATFNEEHPEGSHDDFMRHYNHLIIHHALAQAKVQGRPPVARLDPNRPDKMTQRVVRTVKRRNR